MRLRATDASRGFSAILSRAAAGEVIEIDRHGEVVAVLGPARRYLLSGETLGRLMERLAPPDDRFGEDVRGLASITAPPRSAWES